MVRPSRPDRVPVQSTARSWGGFWLPDCTLERFTVMTEMTLDVDLNGDGRISDISEILNLPEE